MTHLKKLVSALLVLAMLLSAFAFAESDMEDLGGGYYRFTEPVTITVGKAQSPANWPDAQDSEESNLATRTLLEKFNIDIKYDWISDDYYTKLAMSITGGDIPDVFVIDSEHYNLYKELVDNDMLADLSEVYEKYASDYVRKLYEGYDNKPLDAFTDESGALHGLPQGSFYYGSENYLWLRQDWLDELNLEVPKTMEDLEKVLVEFRDKKGSKGLLLSKNVTGTFNSLSSLAAAYDVYPGAWVENDDGEVIYGSIDPRMKDLLTVLQRWYKEGLIHPEFMTNDDPVNQAKFCSGESGTLIGNAWSSCGMGELLNVDGAKVTVAACPVDAEGHYNLLMVPVWSQVLCVSKDCENLAAVMEVVNYVSDKLGEFGTDIYTFYNVQGIQWTSYYPFGNFNLVAADEIIGTYYGIKEYQETGELSRPYELDWLIYLVDKYLKGEPYDAEPSAVFWYTYAYYYVCDLIVQDNVVQKDQAFTSRTESMSDFWSNLQTLESTYLQSIIIGDKDVDAYDEFIASWKTEGGDMITDEVHDMMS